jgi:pimeloyl-ACP methyl ester carboxylesterase
MAPAAASVSPMRRCVLLGILLAGLAAAPADAAVKHGPAGSKFYTPAKQRLKGPHGSVIYARKLSGPEVLKHAAANTLVLYRSVDVGGHPTAVSGTVALPQGKAPKAGWPVITWAHGTTGIGDTCALTRAPASLQQGYDHALLQRWLKAGYAVVRTDYEGLGTPGVHPYLVGRSEARSVLDMVRAVRKLSPKIGKRYIIAGHSQGGQAALWAAAEARTWTPELRLKGTAAFAPVSHLGEQAGATRALTSPSGLSGFVALIARGADTLKPSLGIPALLSDRARALYPQTLTKCLPALTGPSSYGALAPADVFRSGADLTALSDRLNADADPDDLKISTPVLIAQGTGDQTVFPAFTQQLEAGYAARGIAVTSKTYDGLSHRGVVQSAAAGADATAWIRARLR